MFNAILWGLVQGLTEFLPISSSGHLVLVPAFAGVDQPDLATSAFLHLGTLAAVVAYYRNDLARLLRFRTDPVARHIILLLAIGTVPALIGIVGEDAIGSIQESPTRVAVALLFTSLVLFLSGIFRVGDRTVEKLNWRDAAVVGVAQALALVPGISRSGMTMTAGIGRGLDRVQAARFSFLLGVPAIAGAGAQQGLSLFDSGGVSGAVLVGTVVAAVSGYLAISGLVKALGRFGLRPYALYCLVIGILALVFL